MGVYHIWVICITFHWQPNFIEAIYLCCFLTPLHILNALWSMPNWASPEHLKVGIFE